MFQVIIGELANSKTFTVLIDGCPSYGIEAVDFRRKHGLPEAPTDRIGLPARVFDSEEVCRTFILNGEADVCLGDPSFRQRPWLCNAVGEVYEAQYGSSLCYGDKLHVSPDVIREYLANKEIDSAVALLRDVLDYSTRSKARAEAEAAQKRLEKKEKERKIAEARELLKDELAAKDNRIARLERELEKVSAELAALEDDDDDE